MGLPQVSRLGYLGELFILKVRRRNQLKDSIAEKKRVLTIVESEAHFFKIGLEMLCTDFMPTTAQPALEQRECGFNRVCMGIPANVFLDAMLNHLVLFSDSHSLRYSTIGIEFIGEEHINVLADVIAEKLLKDSSGDFLGMEQAEFAVPLPDTDNGPFCGAASAMLNT